MGFRVGDVILITDGKNSSLHRIDGVRKGFLRVGSLLFDWCGNEVECIYPIYKIYPVNEKMGVDRSTDTVLE